MYYWQAEIERPVEFISAGHFTAGYPWIHSKRSVSSYEVIIGLSDIIYLEQDDDRYEVRPGEALLLLPNRTHAGYAYSGPQVSFYWVHFQSSDDCSTLLEEAEGLAELAKYRHNPYVQTRVPAILLPACSKLPEMERAAILFRQLLHIVQARYYTKHSADYMLTSLLIELTQQAIAASEQNLPGGVHSRHRMMHVLEWIRIHASDKISVEDVARELNYNADYLSRLFKKEMGMPMQQYIQKTKIDRAKEELSRTDRTIKEIANHYGFEDEKYFMKLFRKHEHMTPTQFRRAFYRTHWNNK